MAKAGKITIDISAGTAQFVVDMDQANRRLSDFGNLANKVGHSGGQAFRQNGEVALHVTRGHARRLALETATAGRKPRVAAGLRENGRSARRGENRHGTSSPRPKTHARAAHLIIRQRADHRRI